MEDDVLKLKEVVSVTFDTASCCIYVIRCYGKVTCSTISHRYEILME